MEKWLPDGYMLPIQFNDGTKLCKIISHTEEIKGIIRAGYCILVPPKNIDIWVSKEWCKKEEDIYFAKEELNSCESNEQLSIFDL